MSNDEREQVQSLYQARRAGLIEDRAKVERDAERMKAAYKIGTIDLAEWSAERAETGKRLAAITEELERLDARYNERISADLDAAQVELVRAWFSAEGIIQPTFDEKRRLLEKLQITVTVEGNKVLVSGLITGDVMADLEEAALRNKLQRQAWDDLMQAIQGMHDEGRHEEAEDALQSAERGRANGRLVLSITRPPGATVYDSTDRLAAFMSTYSPAARRQ